MRRNDTDRRHAASVEVKIVSEVHLRTNDFGRRHNHASCTALHAYNMYMLSFCAQKIRVYLLFSHPYNGAASTGTDLPVLGATCPSYFTPCGQLTPKGLGKRDCGVPRSWLACLCSLAWCKVKTQNSQCQSMTLRLFHWKRFYLQVFKTIFWYLMMWWQWARRASLCWFAVGIIGLSLYGVKGIRGTTRSVSFQPLRTQSTPWRSLTIPWNTHWDSQSTRRSSSLIWATSTRSIMAMTLEPTGGASLYTGHGAFITALNQSLGESDTMDGRTCRVTSS